MNKEYNIKLNEKEITKLVIFILMYEDKVNELSETYNKLSQEYENFENEAINTFKSNSEYYKEMYEIIQNIRNKLDHIPF